MQNGRSGLKELGHHSEYLRPPTLKRAKAIPKKVPIQRSTPTIAKREMVWKKGAVSSALAV
jgi:hypothetical protein